MKNRKKRIDIIIEIIRSQHISSQEELAAILAEKGHIVTQATLSRDLKMLRTSKIPTERGSYIYTLPSMDINFTPIDDAVGMSLRQGYKRGVKSVKFSGNIAVVLTGFGYASGISADIDRCERDEILGTLAGVNTVLVVLNENITRERAKEVMDEVLSVKPQNLNMTR